MSRCCDTSSGRRDRTRSTSASTPTGQNSPVGAGRPKWPAAGSHGRTRTCRSNAPARDDLPAAVACDASADRTPASPSPEQAFPACAVPWSQATVARLLRVEPRTLKVVQSHRAGQSGSRKVGAVSADARPLSRIPPGRRCQSLIVVPTVPITNASGNRPARWWQARNPVQCAGTSSEGDSSASASTVGAMIGSNIGPLR